LSWCGVFLWVGYGGAQPQATSPKKRPAQLSSSLGNGFGCLSFWVGYGAESCAMAPPKKDKQQQTKPFFFCFFKEERWEGNQWSRPVEWAVELIGCLWASAAA